MKRLPNKPSKLIRLAIRDLEKVEKDSKYEVNMEWLHIPSINTCTVCLAGSVLAKTFKYAPERIERCFSSLELPYSTIKKLDALDSFRLGDIHWGLRILGIFSTISIKESVDIPTYQFNPEEFKRTMLQMADSFEMRGL